MICWAMHQEALGDGKQATLQTQFSWPHTHTLAVGISAGPFTHSCFHLLASTLGDTRHLPGSAIETNNRTAGPRGCPFPQLHQVPLGVHTPGPVLCPCVQHPAGALSLVKAAVATFSYQKGMPMVAFPGEFAMQPAYPLTQATFDRAHG